MKRNKQSTRAMRQRTTSEMHGVGDSRYGRKLRSGNQMYGGKPGCCGHRLVPVILADRRRAS